MTLKLIIKMSKFFATHSLYEYNHVLHNYFDSSTKLCGNELIARYAKIAEHIQIIQIVSKV